MKKWTFIELHPLSPGKINILAEKRKRTQLVRAIRSSKAETAAYEACRSSEPSAPTGLGSSSEVLKSKSNIYIDTVKVVC